MKFSPQAGDESYSGLLLAWLLLHVTHSSHDICESLLSGLCYSSVRCLRGGEGG